MDFLAGVEIAYPEADGHLISEGVAFEYEVIGRIKMAPARATPRPSKVFPISNSRTA
jgi:hypothetical protein